ncbi:MAG: hypothetical protein HYZ47_03755 [Simkania negevensis]|nr:hypothetical protein [Simkania negevensis]
MKRRGLLQSRAYKAFKNFLMRLYTNRQRQYAKLFAAEEIEREDYFQIFSSKKKNQTLPKISIDSKQIELKTQVKKSEIPVCRQPLQAFSCPVPQYRVALISRHFSTIGGLEKTSQRIAEGFSRRGIYVHILTTDQMKKKNLHPLIHCEMLEAKKRLSFRKLEEFDRLCQAWAKAHPTEITFGMDRVRHQEALLL